MILSTIILKSLYGAGAAIGFAVLFNVPRRTLLYISILGAIGVFCKSFMFSLGLNIILDSFIGASVIGILCLFAARYKDAPPLVFSIPAIIPLIPGLYTYKMMIGIMNLSGKIGADFYETLSYTVNNGLKATFILLALSVGVSVPNLILRKDSLHEIIIYFKSKKNNIIHKKRVN